MSDPRFCCPMNPATVQFFIGFPRPVNGILWLGVVGSITFFHSLLRLLAPNSIGKAAGTRLPALYWQAFVLGSVKSFKSMDTASNCPGHQRCLICILPSRSNFHAEIESEIHFRTHNFKNKNMTNEHGAQPRRRKGSLPFLLMITKLACVTNELML